MLVLSRKKDESIVIGDDIEIVVVELRGDKVRLGIDAPREVGVHRREVYDAIHRDDPRPVTADHQDAAKAFKEIDADPIYRTRKQDTNATTAEATKDGGGREQ